MFKTIVKAVGEGYPQLYVIMINYAVGDCTSTCFSLDLIASILLLCLASFSQS